MLVIVRPERVRATILTRTLTPLSLRSTTGRFSALPRNVRTRLPLTKTFAERTACPRGPRTLNRSRARFVHAGAAARAGAAVGAGRPSAAAIGGCLAPIVGSVTDDGCAASV